MISHFHQNLRNKAADGKKSSDMEYTSAGYLYTNQPNDVWYFRSLIGNLYFYNIT